MAIKSYRKFITSFLWDLWCFVSILGIWPRYIEPNLLFCTKIQLKIDSMHPDLEGLRLVQFSDLHFDASISDRFLRKLYKKIMALKPHVILFTGDFITNSFLEDKDRLQYFLCALEAPLGCYAVLGNHDYEKTVSINPFSGDYDVVESKQTLFRRIKQRFFNRITPTGQRTKQVFEIGKHAELMDLLAHTPFKVLENQTEVLSFGEGQFNLCGLEDYGLGKCNPCLGYKQWNYDLKGIVITHNPDGVGLLKNHPASLVLCGHTHGAQINLPFFRERFTLMENKQLRKGLVNWQDKWIYINKGIAGLPRFRFRAAPEILLVTLKKAEDGSA